MDASTLIQSLLKAYPKTLSGTTGCYNKSRSKIYLKENAKPIAFKCQHAAHTLRPLLGKEIERLVLLGHLEPVEISEWATPFVPIFKSNGEIRICGKFKRTVNQYIISDKYPLHTRYLASFKGVKRSQNLI